MSLIRPRALLGLDGIEIFIIAVLQASSAEFDTTAVLFGRFVLGRDILLRRAVNGG